MNSNLVEVGSEIATRPINVDPAELSFDVSVGALFCSLAKLISRGFPDDVHFLSLNCPISERVCETTLGFIKCHSAKRTT